MNVFTTALIGLFLLSGTGTTSADPIQSALDSAPTLSVAMTGYNAVPEQTDADPTTTASGAKSNPEVIAARSRDLADELPYGTVIVVETASTTSHGCGASAVGEQIGYRVIADSMHSRKRNQIDVMFDTSDTVQVGKKQVSSAKVLGVCSDVTVRVIGQVDVKQMPRSQAELKKVVEEQLLAVSK